eukprot:398264-Pleurochrysis_carterae.AAC.1
MQRGSARVFCRAGLWRCPTASAAGRRARGRCTKRAAPPRGVARRTTARSTETATDKVDWSLGWGRMNL